MFHPCHPALREPHKAAYIMGRSGQTVTYAELEARASSSAIDLPMPRVEPVTNATLPLKANRLDVIASFAM